MIYVNSNNEEENEKQEQEAINHISNEKPSIWEKRVSNEVRRNIRGMCPSCIHLNSEHTSICIYICVHFLIIGIGRWMIHLYFFIVQSLFFCLSIFHSIIIYFLIYLVIFFLCGCCFGVERLLGNLGGYLRIWIRNFLLAFWGNFEKFWCLQVMNGQTNERGILFKHTYPFKGMNFVNINTPSLLGICSLQMLLQKET